MKRLEYRNFEPVGVSRLLVIPSELREISIQDRARASHSE